MPTGLIRAVTCVDADKPERASVDRGLALAVRGRGCGQQALGGQAAEHTAQAGGQAGPFLVGEPGEDARLPGLPEAVRDGAPLRGEVEADVAVVLLVPSPPDPPLALQARRQPAHRALLQAEQGRELALGDAVRRQEFGQRAGFRGRHGGKPACPGATWGGTARRGAVRRGDGRGAVRRGGGRGAVRRGAAGVVAPGRRGRALPGGRRGQYAQQDREEPLQLRTAQCGIHRNSCTPQLTTWYRQRVRVASYNYGIGRRTGPQTISSPL